MLCAIPIEIIVRELDYVLYLSLHMASKGLDTLIGDHMVNRFVHEGYGPFIYFDSDQSKKTNTAVLDNGGFVLNLNSELQGYIDDPDQMQRNFIRVIDYASKICLSGENQIEPLSKLVPSDRVKDLIVTGHPSFDLTSPKFGPYYANQEIMRDYGDNYILMNTSFGMFNHEMGFERYMDMLSRMQEWEVYNTAEHRAHLRQRCVHEERMAEAFVELARSLSQAYPKRRIIIRPHPAETTTFYTTRIRNLDNVSVTKQHSVREWIASAGAVIHHDCTTGLEALLMDKLVLQYHPDTGMHNSSDFMSKIGARVTSVEEAINLIKAGTMPDGLRRKTLVDLQGGMDNLDGCASVKLADLASSLSGRGETRAPSPLSLLGRTKCWRKYLSKLLRARQPGRNGKKVRYALNKFSRLEKMEIENRLAKLRRIEPTLPEVRVTELCLNNFIISPHPFE